MITAHSKSIIFFGALLLAGCASPLFKSERAPAETLYVSEPVTAHGLFGKSVEGPAVDRQGHLYFVHNLERGTVGTIIKWSPGKEPQTWLELPQGVVGNSIRFNKEGHLLLADYKGHRIFKVDVETKALQVVIEHREMNQPNDFAIARDGSLFMSDPTWSKKKKGNIWVSDAQGHVQLFDTNLGAPNGIDLSPDESLLYYGESISGTIYRYNVRGGSGSGKSVFYKFKPDTIDGLRTDSAGNVYVARITQGSIDCISPEGKLLHSIPLLGKEPTNLAFGGNDGRTLFVTVRDGGYIESFRTEFPGRGWQLSRGK